jgi:Type II CAAX prenyl endopeptidase Rce1-like
MTARGLWLRVAAATAVALVALVAVSPRHPPRRLPPVLAAPVGLIGGAVLYLAAVRMPLVLATRSRSLPVVAARHAFFALLAADEEVIWRRVALGVLLPRGVLLAVVASSAGFALAHRPRVALQLVTGSVFGTLYVVTGWLATPIGAHWAYNELVARAGPSVPT